MADDDLAARHRRLVGLTLNTAARVVCLAVLAPLVGCSPPTEKLPADPADATVGPPAQRVVTLAPHLTEMVFAAGAGDRLVGTVAHSDYPDAAAQVPRIGDAFRVDFERLAGLAPDLVLAWRGGNPAALVAELERQGYRVVALEPRRVADVARHLTTIGRLTGTDESAGRRAAAFSARWQALKARYLNRNRVDVFFQVAARPLYTVGGGHTVSELIDACGGRNVFADLGELAPVVDLEAVIGRDPRVIIALDAAALDAWQAWPGLTAVRDGHLYAVNGDLVVRPGLRLVAGAEAICEALDKARDMRGPTATTGRVSRALRDRSRVGRALAPRRTADRTAG